MPNPAPPSSTHRRRWTAILTAAAALLLAPLTSSPAQTPENPTPRQQPREKPREARALELQSRAFAAMDRGDLPEAEKLLRQAIATDDGNFVFYYNLACVLSLQGQAEAAASALIDAIEHGFVDLHHLKRDPQIAAARKDPRIVRLIDAWPTVLARQVDANLKAAANLFDGRTGAYRTTRDDRLKIAVMSAMDPQSTEQSQKDIAILYDWGLANVFPDLADPAKAATDAWVAVILPTPKDFVRWLVVTFGQDAIMTHAGIGGSYIHDQKRLVAQDLGATLRHEFFHVLHWRSMTRLGQDHPIWIQEGLCSLVEDYESTPADGPAILKPVPSWRTNIVKRLLNAGRLPPIRQFVTIPRERFTGTNPLSHYAQARTFFLYLHDAGKLKEWYDTYTTDRDRGYHADPTGLKAIEAVFAKPAADVDKAYRAWLRKLPMVAEADRPGAVGLGVDVEPGAGDGPEIVHIPRDAAAARRAGLRVGDVITAINSQPTRDVNELVRVLNTFKPGDTITLSYRRGHTHHSTQLTLPAR